MIEVVGVRREPLHAIGMSFIEVQREGFDCTPREFVQMFCEHMRCKPDTEVTRIEFRYVDDMRVESP